MKAILALASTALLALPMNAQIANKIWAEPAELKALSRKILVVELPEENPKVIEGFPKKTAAADAAAYRASLASYRDQVEASIREHWKYNEEIEFKTTSEIIQLFAKKSTKHVALLKVVLADGLGVYGYTFGMGVPAIVLTRTDGDSKVSKKGQLQLIKHDYQMNLVAGTAEDGTETYTATGLAFTFKQAQKHLEYASKSKKPEDYMQYCKDEAARNCSKMRGKELVLEEGALYKSVDKAEVKENYPGPLSFVSRAELDEIYDSGTSEKAVLYSMPVGTISGTMIVVTVTKLVYMKIVVDPSTDEIIEAVIPGMGKTYVEGLTGPDLRALAECK
jgi:hypothetical protein